MKKMMVLLVIVIPCVLFIQGGVAGAATPKIGAVCMTKNAIAKISGKDSICAVKPSEWNKSHKMYWQDLNAYSSTVDKVIGKLSPADRYQYCLVQNGGPLPGERGMCHKQRKRCVQTCLEVRHLLILRVHLEQVLINLPPHPALPLNGMPTYL